MSEDNEQPAQPTSREQTEALLRLKKQRLAKALVEGEGAEPAAAELAGIVTLEGRLANMGQFERLRALTREPALEATPVEEAVAAEIAEKPKRVRRKTPAKPKPTTPRKPTPAKAAPAEPKPAAATKTVKARKTRKSRSARISTLPAFAAPAPPPPRTLPDVSTR